MVKALQNPGKSSILFLSKPESVKKPIVFPESWSRPRPGILLPGKTRKEKNAFSGNSALALERDKVEHEEPLEAGNLLNPERSIREQKKAQIVWLERGSVRHENDFIDHHRSERIAADFQRKCPRSLAIRFKSEILATGDQRTSAHGIILRGADFAARYSAFFHLRTLRRER
jgi:hypothetical protein